jgi:hypothetical protein
VFKINQYIVAYGTKKVKIIRQKMTVKKEKKSTVKEKISSSLSTVKPGTGGFWNFLKGRSISG